MIFKSFDVYGVGMYVAHIIFRIGGPVRKLSNTDKQGSPLTLLYIYTNI